MIEELFSPYWYRVRNLSPQLKPTARVFPHHYRGNSWYVVRDSITARNHRISATAYQFVAMLDGSKTVDSIWDHCNKILGDDAPTQGDIIHLLSTLHNADLLLSDVSPAVKELLERGNKRSRQLKSSYFKNPAALRFPLVDPDAFLNRTLRWARPLFSWPVLSLCALLCLVAALQAGSHWPQLSDAIGQQALQPYNLLLLALLYPIIKILHELAHAYAVKLEGGEVHELGVMLLVLMPIPYVDASAAAAFPSRSKRILVSAAGMIVELVLSGIALLFWLQMQPGLARDIMLNVVLIGGVSTLLFNGNPLLRYDAYYILSDWISVPNLAQRGNQYIFYLVQRYLYGMTQAKSPVSSEGESKWLFSYSVASFLYRTALMFVICIYLAKQMFFLGVLMALWLVTIQFVLPVVKMLGFLCSERLGTQRGRALWATSAVTLLLVAIVTLVPTPSNTIHEGVVWIPGDSRVSTDVEAQIKRVLVHSGQTVVVGQSLLQLDDPELHAQLALDSARLAELQASYSKHLVHNKARAVAMTDRIHEAEARLARTREKLDALLVRSPADGTIIIPNEADLPGKQVSQGELLAYIMNGDRARVHIAVRQADQDRIQQGIAAAEVRLDGDIGNALNARLMQQTPQANNKLPSKVLSTAGGGKIAVSADDERGLTALDTLFQYELEIPLQLADVKPGMRAYVRFEHGQETLSKQMSRRVRQLFLKHFDA